MALSEREQQMLEQMEEALRAEDPRFASQMNGSPRLADNRRRYVLGGIGALAGLGLVILGINVQIWIGVVGFALIVASIAYAATPRSGGPELTVVDGAAPSSPPKSAGRGPRRRGPKRPSVGGSGHKAPKPPRSGTFMERLEQRWDERRNNGGM